jgi:hypothetical protein
MRLSTFLSCFVLVAFAAYGQGDKGTIAGTVSDSFGVVYGSASVQAKNAESGAVSKATSDKTGKYMLTGLAPGSYDISVTTPGLRPFEQKGVRVEAAKTASLDIRMLETTQLNTLGEDTLGILADQKRRKPPTGPTPRTFDEKPDFSGVWWTPTITDPGKPEWLPNAQKVAKERADNNRKDAPQAHCLPSPVLRLGPVYELVQAKSKLVFISDDDSPGFRQVYLARNHPKDPDPLWYGDSVGHWEGETLVIDRISFIDDVWLDQESHPHSDKLHVVERYRRPDLGHLETEVTVEDPAVLAKPWTFKRVSELAPTEEVREFMCTENNQDPAHMVGK